MEAEEAGGQSRTVHCLYGEQSGDRFLLAAGLRKAGDLDHKIVVLRPGAAAQSFLEKDRKNMVERSSGRRGDLDYPPVIPSGLDNHKTPLSATFGNLCKQRGKKCLLLVPEWQGGPSLSRTLWIRPQTRGERLLSPQPAQ